MANASGDRVTPAVVAYHEMEVVSTSKDHLFLFASELQNLVLNMIHAQLRRIYCGRHKA